METVCFLRGESGMFTSF